MAFSFQVGPPVLGLGWSGTGRGACAATGARTKGQPGSRAETGANVSSGFRAWARADASPGTGTGIWARESGVYVKTGFVDKIVSRFSVFKGVCADSRTTHGVLFHSVYTES